MKQLLKQIISNIRSTKDLYNYISDYIYMRKHSLSNPSQSQDRQLATIMLLMHALEKGMSFPSQRTFGEQKAITLTNKLITYLKSNSRNTICTIAINVLAEYMRCSHSTQNETTRTHIQKLLNQNQDIIQNNYAGTKEIQYLPNFNKQEIETFYKSRSSIRFYSNEPVTDDEIKEAIKIASTTPTACNRQACRIHVYRDKDLINKLINNQLGDQGWCHNAPILFVITTNVSYFNNLYERYQPLIDGGLYAMNFDMGLHLNHIGSCFKMFVRNPKIEKEFKKLAQIPENEIPIVLILAGHYPKHSIKSPQSVRIDDNNPLETVTIH